MEEKKKKKRDAGHRKKKSVGNLDVERVSKEKSRSRSRPNSKSLNMRSGRTDQNLSDFFRENVKEVGAEADAYIAEMEDRLGKIHSELRHLSKAREDILGQLQSLWGQIDGRQDRLNPSESTELFGRMTVIYRNLTMLEVGIESVLYPYSMKMQAKLGPTVEAALTVPDHTRVIRERKIWQAPGL